MAMNAQARRVLLGEGCVVPRTREDAQCHGLLRFHHPTRFWLAISGLFRSPNCWTKRRFGTPIRLKGNHHQPPTSIRPSREFSARSPAHEICLRQERPACESEEQALY